jgi:murein L,D-transpeptidase YcbB/YkuD
MESKYPDFKEKTLSDSLRIFLTDTAFTDTNSVYATAIDSFYRINNYQPVWTKNIFENPHLDTLLSYIQRVADHGLNPEYFKKTIINNLLDSLKNGFQEKEPTDIYQSFRQLEYLLTKAYMAYATGLKYGFLSPAKLFPADYFIEIQSPDSAFYAGLFDAIDDPDAYLAGLQPTDTLYLQLQKLLKQYESLQEVSFDSIVFDPKKTKNYVLNQANANFPLIAQRLMLTGELEQTDRPDSVYATLTKELLAAVNVFRVNHSYPEDKELGEVTINALNRPLSYYYKTIQANLERYRWKRTTPASDKYIHVNVAALNLLAVESGYAPLTMNVCAGRAVKNQTPLLESEVSYMNLNPTWNVPASIIEKEVVGNVRKDPAYLKKQRMTILKGTKVINPATIDWKKINPKHFPYLIRQDSGDGNSLGRIKFMFNNSFSVYLHDTNLKSRFLYKDRAVSHGCVRVQKPMDLAFFCLTEKDSVYFDKLRTSIDLPPVSTEGKKLLKQAKLGHINDIVFLKTKVPLTIDYRTVYTLLDGKTYFADDIYGFDNRIRKALEID